MLTAFLPRLGVLPALGLQQARLQQACQGRWGTGWHLLAMGSAERKKEVHRERMLLVEGQ